MSVFFGIDTVLIVALIGSPLILSIDRRPCHEILAPNFLACCWWGWPARELILFLLC